MSSDREATAGWSPRSDRPPRLARSLRSWPALAAPVGVVTAAAAVGWLVAGPPPDSTAVTPTSCPPAFASPAAIDSTGSDLLVPVGPVSARLCGYRSSSPGLLRERVLDPARTAALAGLLDAGRRPAVAPAVAAGCPPGPEPAVLVFRYRRVEPLLVAVAGGGCQLVSMSGRAETDRPDVVREVADLLTGG